MRPSPIPFLLTALGGCLLLPLSSPAPLTAYLKIDDIDGESQAAGREDWIIIESLVTAGVEAEVISGLPTGKRQHRPLTVIKPLDKASPLLMNALANCEPIDTVTFEAVEPYPGADGSTREVTYLRYKLEQARVTGYDVTADPGGDPDRPVVEEVVFEFPYAEWHVRQMGPGGNEVVDSAGAFFDMQLNEAGPANIAPVISQVDTIETGAGETFEFDVRIEDFDTPFLELLIGNETDPATVKVGPIRWMAPEMLRFELTTTTAASGQVPFTLFVSDGDHTASMSFSIFVDSTGTPWDGFMMAYFTADERADPAISSPIEDPDGDDLETLLEFLLGTNPREFTPIEIRRAAADGGGGGGGRIAVWPAYLDPDDDGDSIDVVFDRRVDDPRITLSLMASFDGGDAWQRLEPGIGENPLYKETSEWKENAISESVNGTVDPPDEATSVMLRFVGVME